MNNSDYNRLLYLKDRIDNNTASTSDKKEYIELMYRNGKITETQYQNYLKNKNADDIINAALTIGGVMLVTWLVSKLFEK